MLLADPAELLADLGFDDMVDINSAITEALHAAEPVLASYLRTQFDQVTVTDIFFIEMPGWMSSGSGMYKTEFLLSRGFVTNLGSISSSFTPTGDSMDVSGAIIGGAAALEKGHLRDLTTIYSNQFVTITYTAGFPVDTVNSQSYDISLVPDWLEEAAKLQAKITLAGSPALEQTQIKIDTKALGVSLRALVGGKVRYAPLAFLPL